ncbi:MAG: OmpA family protein [Bacteroidales bacterium]|nr:OmpA family protein [Bacteroidales bacterium]
MKHSIFIIVFLIIFSDLDAQREKVKTFYDNGTLQSKGSVFSYSNFDWRIPKKYAYFKGLKKRDGEWKYWYQNGQLERIENYKATLNLKKLDDLRNKWEDLPHGKWIYYTEQGNKYRDDFFKDGILYNSTKEIYNNNQQVGEITVLKGIWDTIWIKPLSSGPNLILNPDFELFYYKPIPIISNGKSKLEDWIPFWVTPGLFTPDYLSYNRFINVLNYNYLLDFPLPDKFNYAGLALYKKSEPYSEYIQGQIIKPLSKGQKYCLKVSIALASYSGFSVDHLAIHLSTKPIKIHTGTESSFKPQVILSTSKVNNKQFITICDFFIAGGGEQFITIGRFAPAESLEIISRKDMPKTNFGIDISAYYLIDKVELNEIQDKTECSCNNTTVPIDTIKQVEKPYSLLIENDLTQLKTGNSIILKNVNFQFDSYELLQSADSVLFIVKKFLTDNPDLKLLISGHTDDIGSDEYNLELSINRAKAVYNWLIKNGIDSSRLNFTGFGKKSPLYMDFDESTRAINRRVEVKVLDNF